MHLAEQLNQKIVKIYKKTTKKFSKIITSTTKKSLRLTLQGFDKAYIVLAGIGKLVKLIVRPLLYKPTKAQLAYVTGVIAIVSVVHFNTNASQELHNQLNDTSQQLQQKEEVIEVLEDKTENIDTELKQKVEKLEEAETDIEKLEKEKKAKDAEIQRLEQELQAKLQKQEATRLASVQQVQQTQAIVEPTIVTPAPQPVVASSGGYADGNNYPHGECTWGADVLAGVPNGLGNASQWSYTLPQHGYVSTAATPGAIAVFPPGVQGASGWGHVGVVTSVNGDGTVTIGESNFAGVRSITYRTTSTAGVQFFVR